MTYDPRSKLEVGSNVFELIEFSLDRNMPNGRFQTGRYGVNVAKVREVVRMPVINSLASRVAGVEGVFELRGIPIPAINLAIALGDKHAPINPTQQIIVTEFSGKRAGFIVKTTHRIRRIGWEKVLPPTADREACISGMTLIENNEFLFILDLEKIILEMERKSGYDMDPTLEFHPKKLGKEEGGDHKAPIKDFIVLVVDDSAIILSNARQVLEQQGFTVITASNGLLAQQFLLALGTPKSKLSKVDIVITDVEMPKLDGLTLTKWIKSQEKFKSVPVILHTSLSGKVNEEAGRSVGADGYILKNDFHTLVETVKKFESTH